MKNLFIEKYGDNQKLTYYVKPIVKIKYHTNECDKIIYTKIDIKDLNCTCRNQNKLKLRSNFKMMSKRFITKALHNFQNEKELSFLTLTFRENVTDLNLAYKQIKKFLRILKNKYKKINVTDKPFKYCYVWEQQQRGSIHFHMLFNQGENFKKIYPIENWIKLNPTALPIAQKLILVKTDTNKFIILYFAKYFSKETHENFKNKRVFLFSKNCENILKESYFFDWNVTYKKNGNEFIDKNKMDRIKNNVFKNCDFVKEFGYYSKIDNKFNLIGYVGYRNLEK